MARSPRPHPVASAAAARVPATTASRRRPAAVSTSAAGGGAGGRWPTAHSCHRPASIQRGHGGRSPRRWPGPSRPGGASRPRAGGAGRLRAGRAWAAATARRCAGCAGGRGGRLERWWSWADCRVEPYSARMPTFTPWRGVSFGYIPTALHAFTLACKPVHQYAFCWSVRCAGQDCGSGNSSGILIGYSGLP